MKYTNETRAAGVHVTEASPLDDRKYIATEEEVAILENKEPMPSVMYDGMMVYFLDSGKTYVWVESAFGLMAVGYTYPAWFDDVQGHNYAFKTYNFILADAVAKVETTYEAVIQGAILIPNRKLPRNVLKDMENAVVTLRSHLSDYKDLEYPDEVEAVEEGLIIRFDPAPIPPEHFKITIS